MKKLIITLLFIAQVLLAGTAMATPVSVDFSVLGTTIDITQPGPGATLNGITFRYDDFNTGLYVATVDSAGVFGDPLGLLVLDFSTPATALSLEFELFDAISFDGDGSQMPDSLFVQFYLAGAPQNSVSIPADFFAYDPTIDPTLGFATGLLDYQGPAFDQAMMFFSPDALFFTVSNVTYAPVSQPVPEPATCVLLASGLIGLVGWQRRGRKC